jgi:hypothetical protein
MIRAKKPIFIFSKVLKSHGQLHPDGVVNYRENYLFNEKKKNWKKLPQSSVFLPTGFFLFTFATKLFSSPYLISGLIFQRNMLPLLR